MDSSLGLKTYIGATCMAYCCAGETCFHNDFSGNGWITMAFKLPGDILPFMVGENQSWLLNQGAYICSTPNVAIEARFAGCLACCCGGENPFLTKCVSKDGLPGVFYAGGYGAITRHNIKANEVLVLDNGLFFAAEASVQFELGLPGGLFSYCFGGEGICMRITAVNKECVVFTQNRDPFPWKKLTAVKPTKKKSAGSNNLVVA